ncbi:AraC family transcriptional regulator [Thalassovita sp.]|uniref:helix-turn-helix transcriptional regulator n=1 Tax=Thalassovita sp. TaxID=1979401 RepID=UPI002B26DA7B|nr:AraC family transcriptional regulator [Thalassovita sp.]
MRPHRTTGQMAIGRDRFFYSGLLGNSGKPRRMGGVTIYVAPEGELDIGFGKSGRTERRQIAALAPYETHRLISPCGRILNLGFEPESLRPEDQARLIARCNDAERGPQLAQRIRDAEAQLSASGKEAGFTNTAFDLLFLGETLAERPKDRRIKEALATICIEIEDNALSADDLAAKAGLSTSRFLHLFKENTGIAFRSLRMWKRARRFLDHANGSESLTEVALELGYPDSSHFSHSIRRTYGLKPRSIRLGSRNLKVFAGAGYTLGPDRVMP